jgi:trehalose synthase-fused probable maltokinase
MTSGLSDLATPTGWADLGELLHRWIIEQRWFGGKARESVATEIADTAMLTGDAAGDEVLVVLLAVDYGDGAPGHYHLPLVADPKEPIGTAGRVTVGDAAADPRGVRVLTAAATSDRAIPTTVGSKLVGGPQGEPEIDLDLPPRWLRTEQSNSAAVLGDRWFVKVFRRLEPGPNPEVELTAGLTEAGFPDVPPQAGALGWGGAATEAPTLVMVSRFEADTQDAWQQALAEADAVAGGRRPPHGLVDGAADLGRVVADLHRTLAESFGTHEVGYATLAGWTHTMQLQLDEVLELAAAASHPQVRAVADAGADLRGRFEGLADLGDAGRTTRVHGDLHLGQLLRRSDGRWLVLDFEGEPARELAERRRPHSPLRDVAGMIRSFDYAAAHGSVDEHGSGPPPELRAWRDELTRAFTAAYDAAAPPQLLPSDPSARRALRAAFVLDKAVYELGYELNNRPSWAPIPAGGVLRVLAGDGAEVTT